jgi:hypothetical protein
MYCNTTVSVEIMRIPHRKTVTKSRKLRRLQMMVKVIADIKAKELRKIAELLSNDISVITKSFKQLKMKNKKNLRISFAENIEEVRIYERDVQVVDDFRTMALELSKI